MTIVTYLNRDWRDEDGGELLLYSPNGDEILQRVVPRLGTVIVFLSEEFPHEVCVGRRERYSVAAWFRVNGSVAGRVDPPR